MTDDEKKALLITSILSLNAQELAGGMAWIKEGVESVDNFYTDDDIVCWDDEFDPFNNLNDALELLDAYCHNVNEELMELSVDERNRDWVTWSIEGPYLDTQDGYYTYNQLIYLCTIFSSDVYEARESSLGRAACEALLLAIEGDR